MTDFIPRKAKSLLIRIVSISVLTLIFLFFTAGFHASPGRGDTGTQDQFTDHLNSRIPVYMESFDIPGLTIALITEGRTVWTNAYGYADLENGRKMSVDNYCRVESISKSVTAWGVLNLIEAGLIDPDAPVENYFSDWEIPSSEFDASAVTTDLLLSQCSGMPLGTIGVRYDPSEELPGLKEQLTKDAVLFREPGTSFSYSNAGYNMLELLIEELSEKDFASYMRDEVLLPLGMKHATFEWDPGIAALIPNGHDNAGNAIHPYVYPDKASGGLFATVADIAVFVSAGMPSYRHNPVLLPENIWKLYTPRTALSGFYGLAFDNYGYGHFIEYLNDSLTAVSHGGQGSGWMTHFHSVPEMGDAIVMLTNSQNSWPFFAYMLRDWAKWCGYTNPGMTRILLGNHILRAIIVLLLVLTLWVFWVFLEDMVAKKRRFAPFSPVTPVRRTVQILISLLTAGLLIWAASQDYLFVSSVFPLTSKYLGMVLIFFSPVLMLNALFPRKT